MARQLISILACLFGLVPLLSAQQEPESRTDEIEADRAKKAAELAPETTTGLEKGLRIIKERKLIERFTGGVAGFRLKVGGLATGQGFAAGPEYLRRDLLNGQVSFRASARASIQEAQVYDMDLSLPKLSGGLFFIDLYGAYRNYPRVDYYGQGPLSKKTGRSNFLVESLSSNFTLGLRPWRYLSLGADGGTLDFNVGPGHHPDRISADQIYHGSDTPGIDRQTNFLRGGGFLRFDSRDIPGGPRRGGLYEARFDYFADRTLKQYSFRRVNLEAQQYIPFFNDRRVIALRGHAVLTDTNSGQRVPFYLQPTVGGSETLRGFRPYRFYDNNMIVLNAEYRWETFSGLDMALFFDAGKVFTRIEDWNQRSLEGSAGFGFRFNVRNSVFLRVDIGFSREGYQIWAKFNNVF